MSKSTDTFTSETSIAVKTIPVAIHGGILGVSWYYDKNIKEDKRRRLRQSHQLFFKNISIYPKLAGIPVYWAPVICVNYLHFWHITNVTFGITLALFSALPLEYTITNKRRS